MLGGSVDTSFLRPVARLEVWIKLWCGTSISWNLGVSLPCLVESMRTKICKNATICFGLNTNPLLPTEDIPGWQRILAILGKPFKVSWVVMNGDDSLLATTGNKIRCYEKMSEEFLRNWDGKLQMEIGVRTQRKSSVSQERDGIKRCERSLIIFVLRSRSWADLDTVSKE